MTRLLFKTGTDNGVVLQRAGYLLENRRGNERHIRQMNQPALPVRRGVNAGGNGIAKADAGQQRDRNLIGGANLLNLAVVWPGDHP
ncbi:hypothetical protein D3C71_1554340 [compost metagenome]